MTVWILWTRPSWMGDVVLVGVFATQAAAEAFAAHKGWAANVWGVESHAVLT